MVLLLWLLLHLLYLLLKVMLFGGKGIDLTPLTNSVNFGSVLTGIMAVAVLLLFCMQVLRVSAGFCVWFVALNS
ncbi:hypothetical protein [Citrobacter koseri]|uniref:hypothetical protein n=1 Tax=Citrobacter koseri TaxID=545 RepID=UPI00073592B2